MCRQKRAFPPLYHGRQHGASRSRSARLQRSARRVGWAQTMAEVPQHPVDCGLGAQSTEILLRYALGLNTSAPAHETVPSPPTKPPPTAASSPPAPPYCHIRVHGRKQQSSFDTWVASIQVTAGCKIAVVLAGSESFQMALKQLRRHWAPHPATRRASSIDRNTYFAKN